MDPTTKTMGSALGEFLRSRRALLTPESTGIVSYGPRRVPGLRREELAQLAGVSATYYTRLEQGQSANASASVIDALASALGLDDDERTHLHDLAGPAAGRRRRAPRPDVARPGTLRLIEAMTDVPAVVMGRRTEVLGWNRLGHALVAGHYEFEAPLRPGDRPNLTRMLFLDPHTRDLYADWDGEAARAVASLRLVAGRHRDDRELAELVGELTLNSEAFARLWSKHPVSSCTSGTKHFRHPELGSFSLEFELLHLPEDGGHRVITYTSIADTPSATALQLMAARIRACRGRGAEELGPTE